MTVLIISIVMGLFFIGCGYLVKAYPDLIAGYNTMPEAKKKKFDIEGFSTMMKKNLIVQGITIIALAVLFKLFRVEEEMFSIIVLKSVVFVGMVILIVKGQKYDGNRSAKPSVKPPTEEDYQEMIEKLNE